MSASKASRFFSFALFITSIWLFSCLKAEIFPEHLRIYVYTFPILAGIVLGVFAVSNLTYHMITFKECPEAFAELMIDVKEAKRELSKLGIKVE